MNHYHTRVLLSTGALLIAAQAANAATFFGPTAYTSSADTPAGFHNGPVFLEDFEDGTLDGGITASAGDTLSNSTDSDSVDADDGLIDGSGLTGTSFFTVDGVGGITFAFADPVTAFGLVLTDGVGPVAFSAFGETGDTLFDTTINMPWDTVFNGTTAEDRFIGLADTIGIKSVFVASTTTGGLEVDHLQYSIIDPDTPAPVPLPASLPLLAVGLGVLGLARRRTFGKL